MEKIRDATLGSVEREKFVKEVAFLLGNVGFLMDSSRPGSFFDEFVVPFRKRYERDVEKQVREIFEILEIDDEPEIQPVSPPQAPQSQSNPVPVPAPNQSSIELLQSLKQKSTSTGQFSKGLRDPTKSFKEIIIKTPKK